MEEGHATTRIRLATALAVDLPDGRTLRGRDLGSRKARTLLALLASERGSLVPLDRLVDSLWPKDGPADPAANVATLVSRTRKVLGAGLLTATGRAYGLSPHGPWTLDLDEAADLVTEAGARTSEPVLAAAAARGALTVLGSQPALTDEDDADWVVAVRRETDGLRRRARHLLAEALRALDPSEAVAIAEVGVSADPFDEQAVRVQMRALVADGRASAALAAYDDLAARLSEELGTAPDRETSDLHLAVLRETSLPSEGQVDTAAVSAERQLLLGREPELALVERAWGGVGSSGARLLLVQGEAGIGKSRLLDAVADLAAATGGLVLRGRCHPAERSLFLQPFVDALRPTLLDAAPAGLTRLLRDHTAAWVSMLPEVGAVVTPTTPLPADVDLQRRQAYDAVAAVLRRLALQRPVLLTLDDVQDGGAATIDLLGYLAGRVADAPVLVVAAVRAEDAAVVTRLVDRATKIHLGALPRSAVDALAAAAGLASHGEQVMLRTAGHPLSVVEYLRALAQGDTGVPESLAEAVLTRVARLDDTARAVVDGAAVLRRRVDPSLLAALVEMTELATTRTCEELVSRRLLVRSGHHYEFANDLLQECLYAALPPALALALHRRAADLTADRPEVMAEHAYAAGDGPRAAQGWLLAGEAAQRRAALEDALGLLDRSLAVETSFAGTRARALLARAAVHDARTDFADALADVDAALSLARGTDDRRLEMAALRMRGGDAAVGLGLTVDELVPPLEEGLRVAAGLGDRRAEADFSSRLAILDASRLRLAEALARAERSVARARGAGSEDALVLALDGLKNVWSYLGDPARLGQVVGELEPLLRRRGDTWLLQWTVFESSFVPAGEGRLDDARARVAGAMELNRLSGYPAYAGYLAAHDGWYARLSGDLDEARRIGRAALEATSPVRHPWWYAVAAGLLAATLVQLGDHAEAEAVARRGLALGETAMAGGRLRCLAAAAALGDEDAAAEASRLLDAIECPPGHAWVAGADVYLLLGRADVLAPAIEHTWPHLNQR